MHLRSPILFLLIGASATACVPEGRNIPNVRVSGSNADGGTRDTGPVVIPDAGFDEAGVAVDTGPRPDTGVLPNDTGPRPDTGGMQTSDGGSLGRDAAIVPAVYDNCTAFSQQLDVPIIVNDGDNATVQRRPGFTSFMVPFARSTGLLSLNALTVLDGSGNRLPAQFESLSRWNDHPGSCASPIRHAYVHVRAVPNPGQTAMWRVVQNTSSAGESTPLVVTESPQQWVIDTGAARFTVRRDRFEGLSKVELTGGGTPTTVSEITGNVGQFGFLLDHGGIKSTGHATPWYLQLERAGPQTVTIAARGFYGANAGDRDLGYTVRLHFYADSAAVKVDHTYYHHAVDGWSAGDAINRTRVDRSVMRIPLSGTPAGISARANSTVHDLAANANAKIEQHRRTPQQRALRFTVMSGATTSENGTRADSPFLAARFASHNVMATIARMAVREPQAIGWDSASGSIDVEFTSTPINVGGARGIYSTAAIDFAAPNVGAAGAQLQLHAERPLLGTPDPTYVNGTATIGPYAANTTRFATFFNTMDNIHNRTVNYLDAQNITGIQVWPDMPRLPCHLGGGCGDLHTGGDNNYWNWSKVGIDEFFRTGLNHYFYDFSYGEAKTFGETLMLRTAHDDIDGNSCNGIAPCYGDGYGWGNDWQEGNNSRRDRCPGDYTYNKHLKMAYLASGDRRFPDMFEEGGQNVILRFENPAPANPQPFLEITFSRLSFQRFEALMNSAEFSRDVAVSMHVRTVLRSYIDRMLLWTLIDGHACDTGGSGTNDALGARTCVSGQGFFEQSPVEFVRRAARFFNHAGLQSWLIRHGEVFAEHLLELDGNGLPNYGARNGANGWRTVYQCQTSATDVLDNTCRRFTTGEENDGYYYDNGLMAVLNMFGLILGADPSDPNRICQWLPAAFNAQVNVMNNDVNINDDNIWGKSSGQAYQMSPQAAGAMTAFCP